MQEKILNWIVPASIELSLENGSKEKIIDELIALLEKTGNVSFPTIVKQDIMHREEQGSTLIAEGLCVPHAHTAGVESFCAAVGIVNRTDIYVLLAWNEHTALCLKRLAAIIETLQIPEIRAAILAAQSSEEILESLRPRLQKYNIDI